MNVNTLRAWLNKSYINDLNYYYFVYSFSSFLGVLRKRKEADFLPLPPIKLSKPKKTRADINHDYYENLKKDPSKYRNLLERQRRVSKKNRVEMMANPEKKASYNEKTAERMRKYRLRMKEKGHQSKTPKIMTRKEAELQEKRT